MDRTVGFAVSLTLVAFMLCGCDPVNVGLTNKPATDEGAAKAFAVLPDAAEQKALAIAGADVYSKFGCGNCHSRGESRDSFTGPPLGKAAQRHLSRQKNDELATRRWFFSHIRNPKAHPGVFHSDGAYSAKMPAFEQIPEEELRALVEFLMTKR